MPRGKCSDWIFINVFFFLLICRKRKFCAEPMRERLTFHFELRTRSVNFRFFFSFFFSFFLFFQIKARSRLVTVDIHNQQTSFVCFVIMIEILPDLVFPLVSPYMKSSLVNLESIWCRIHHLVKLRGVSRMKLFSFQMCFNVS